MNKTCVFIIGTNAVGKSSVARSLIEHYGGVDRIEEQVTYAADNSAAFAGPYKQRFCGVDRIVDEQGHQSTGLLAGVVETALKTADVCFCEGSYMDTFGLNVTNAIFKAQRQLVVFLYASPSVLYNRIIERNGGKRGGRNGNGVRFEMVVDKQKRCLRAARKWVSIGVPVLSINTEDFTPEEIANQILNRL